MFILSSDKENAKLSFLLITIVFVIMLLSLALVNYLIDPRLQFRKPHEKYIKDFVQALNQSESGVKRPFFLSYIKYELGLNSTADCFIIGNSQLYWMISEKDLETSSCQVAGSLNLTLPALGLNEFILYSKLARDKKVKTVFLEVPFNFYDMIRLERWSESYHSKFEKAYEYFELKWDLSIEDQFLQKIKYLISVESFQQSLQFILEEKGWPNLFTHPRPLKPQPTLNNPSQSALLKNGAIVWSKNTIEETSQKLDQNHLKFLEDLDNSLIGKKTFQTELMQSLSLVTKVVRKLKENKQKIVLYIPPLDLNLIRQRRNLSIYNNLLAYQEALKDLALKNNLDLLGGLDLCDSSDFFDGFHPRRACLKKALSHTILQSQ